MKWYLAGHSMALYISRNLVYTSSHDVMESIYRAES
jgi:hypothetical protein